MAKKRELVALYKAFTGGEWFETSLNSISPVVDGVVVVFSKGPWLKALQTEEDCRLPFTRWRDAYPDMPVETLVLDCTRQEDQYKAGLEAVRMAFGPDAMVLIIDTDEVWEQAELQKLRDAMEADSKAKLFRCGIYTYLKSPLYQVWPHETGKVVVGLQNCKPRAIRGRFNFQPGTVHVCDVATAFHHLPYVRRDDAALRSKLLNTGSQEHVGSDFSWFDRVYAALPDGRNLHMSVGFEHYWQQIKVLHPALLPPVIADEPFARQKVVEADQEWRAKLQTTPPADALVPVPRPDDVVKYQGDFRVFDDNYNALVSRLNTTVLEALHLVHLARAVPCGGLIVEIGSGSGGSMACMALGSADDVRLVSVDPFQPYDEQTHAGIVRDVREGKEDLFWQTADEFGYRDRVSNIKRLSSKAHRELVDGSCDLLFVDGNHSYDVARKDLSLYWSKVKPGGVLVGHDYTTRFPGVIQAVDEWAYADKVVTPAGTSLFLVRKETV